MKMSESRMLFDILDKIGASKKMRQLLKEKTRNYEIFHNIGPYQGIEKTYNFGSYSEGTTTPGLKSDLDVVFCFEELPVVLKLEDAPKQGMAALLIQDQHTAPGYVKLQSIFNGLVDNHCFRNVHINEKFELIKQDKRGRCCLKNISNITKEYTIFRKDVHGPAITLSTTDVPTDCVFSLRCMKWPSFAKEWLERERHYHWPDTHIINQCNKLGFFVVKIGHPYSKEQDIEWRISFSLQERLLMFILTEVQHKCYIMLKLTKRDLIVGTIGKSITSYICKTCLLYTIEQHPQSIWYPENLFQCVIECLKLLLLWARKGHCPNYFIRDENLFDGRLTGKTRKRVISVLENILAQGESFLFRIETGKVGEYVTHRKDKCKMEVIEDESYQAVGRFIFKLHTSDISCFFGNIAVLLCNRICQSNIHQTKRKGQSINDVKDAMCRLWELINWLKDIKPISEYNIVDTKEAIDLLFPFLDTSLACHLLSFALKCENISHRNKYINLSNKKFQEGLTSDVASGRLKYITSLYILGKYELCKLELVSLEQKFQSSVISISPFRAGDGSDIINIELQRKLNKHKYTTKYFLQHHVCAYVIFLPTELEIIPYALQFEMFRSTGLSPESRHEKTDFWYDWVVVESQVYMYFLWYLLAEAMHASCDERFAIISKLQLVADDHVNRRLHAETAYNLLAWVLRSENLIPRALRSLVSSWNILRLTGFDENAEFDDEKWEEHNAAKWHMLLLLQQMWFSKISIDYKNTLFSFCFKCFTQFPFQLKKCSCCKVAQYCPRNCQTNDWNIHRKICNKIR